ncbi:autotransporter secretion inner membrane protein TamB [Orbus hercynius]|uniref:Autotransporter secretion inner membrane protein TamB n=1 Tax=Orbus hercynius TaxID=593135 RepID=A0A495RD57_9GAMM|nr:translocation/assembly module TamB domain-containing protein [Orbus hercynius]RKS85200.1 autotransporter secretion inner membrane protein TamB [Orbus hercynius]
MKSPHRIKKVKRIKRIRKWKKRSLVVLCSFIFLICFLLILIYTSLGIKIISSIIEKVMPEIQIQHVSGALNDLKIEGFSMNIEGVDVKVGKAALSLSGLCLIEGKICIKDLDVDDVLVNVHTDAFTTDENQTTEPVSTERSVINMPLPLELRKANLSNVVVNVDDMQFGLTQFTGSATWINEKVYVFPANADGVKALFPDTPTNAAVTMPVNNADSSNQSISDTINAIFNQPLLSSLPTVNIPLDVYVNNLSGDDWLLHIGGSDYQFNALTIQATTENNVINAKLLKTSAKTPYGDGDIAVKGKIILGDAWPVSANISLKTQAQRDQASTEITSVIDGRLLGELTMQTQIKGLNQANIDAKIDFSEKYMPATVQARGSMIQWPIFGQPEYQLKNFNVDLSGAVTNYHLNAKGDFYGQSLPTILFDMQTVGTNEALNINSLSVKLPQGEFDLSGNVDWLSTLKWDAVAYFKKIDLTKEIPNYPIKLDGQLKTHGSFDPSAWTMNIDAAHITGSLNQAPLQVSGNVGFSSNQFVTANKFNVKWGGNTIDINGSSRQDNLLADLRLPDLSVIEHGLVGNISGKLTVKGSINEPIIKSHLVIDDFSWQDIVLEQAQLNLDAKYSNLLSGKLQLTAKHLATSSLVVDNAEIEVSGNELNHILTVRTQGKPISTSINLEGHVNKERTQWQGALSEAIIAFNPKNSWKINQPVKLQYNLTTQQGSISSHCWVNKQSQICLDKNLIIADKGQASLVLSNIDLTLFEVINQGETRLSGTVHGKASIKWSPEQKIPTIVANIESKDVYISQQIASQTLAIPFDLFAINANINDTQAKLDWNFSIKEFGRFNGYVNVADPVGKKTLSGQVVIDELSLSIINPLLDNSEHADGIINGKVKFSGTLLDPYITGNIDLEHSDIKTTQLPADIQSIMIDIDFNGKSSTLNGKLQTKAGIVDIVGRADWTTIDNWSANVSVNGAAIEVTIPPMVTMTVVPDIRLQANQDELNLTGKISIPQASIKVESLPPSTIDVSSDEVMLNSNLEEIEPQDLGMKINSRVFVSLGDKVSIDAFGLIARLSGGVYVSQTSKGLSVNGQINIPQGQFKAYGQDLIVRKGEIFFAGPVDQPRLNIEAIRNPESIENNVVAGIRVTGLADEPKTEIFSEPAMSQQEALSYLLRGQGLDGGDQSENDMMTALLIGLGTAQSGQLIGSIGSTFGIKNLTLDTQGVGDSQKVVVSGYILPHLQLKYGVGIFDSLATFTLRYRLLPRLYLEVISGLDQTVDLIYQFEF